MKENALGNYVRSLRIIDRRKHERGEKVTKRLGREKTQCHFVITKVLYRVPAPRPASKIIRHSFVVEKRLDKLSLRRGRILKRALNLLPQFHRWRSIRH